MYLSVAKALLLFPKAVLLRGYKELIISTSKAVVLRGYKELIVPTEKAVVFLKVTKTYCTDRESSGA